MKTLICLFSAFIIPAASAVISPSAALEEIESDIIPRIRTSNEFQLTKVPRINSSGRSIPKGTCIFSNGEVSVTIEYCDMARPQAQRIDLKDLVSGEQNSVYLERNSATLLPGFKFDAVDQNGMCNFISFYGAPRCHDQAWSSDVVQYRSFNSRDEAPADVINMLMNFATRIETIDLTLRNIARSRP